MIFSITASVYCSAQGVPQRVRLYFDNEKVQGVKPFPDLGSNPGLTLATSSTELVVACVLSGILPGTINNTLIG